MTSAIHPVIIALGSNLGDSLTILRRALQHLTDRHGLRLVRCSHWYRTPPLGPPQPDFFNGCALFDTSYSPQELLHILRETEQFFGRVRTGRWQPRTLDLDIIFYDQTVIQTPDLTIPHPEYHRRAFVLVPLAEIAPHWPDPRTGVPVATLVKQVDCTGIRIVPD
ncbi:MAG: 2-amino-4-hydroxy-6-hydroxymethyldihydropteridine diphosphokinase [Gloeomargarita sp. GMQP_bins_120]